MIYQGIGSCIFQDVLGLSCKALQDQLKTIDQEPIENQDSIVLPLRPPHSALDSTCFCMLGCLGLVAQTYSQGFQRITGYLSL